MTKILIVEDEVGLITLLKYNLEKQGYETIIVMDGKDVMATAMQEKPDLILLDCVLVRLQLLKHFIDTNKRRKYMSIVSHNTDQMRDWYSRSKCP